MNFVSGAIVAVHCVGEPDETTNFTAKLSQLENVMVHNSYEFLDLAATATPSNAKPQFEGNDGMDDGSKNGGEGLLSNVQFMVIGAFMGILATVVYYQFARFC